MGGFVTIAVVTGGPARLDAAQWRSRLGRGYGVVGGLAPGCDVWGVDFSRGVDGMNGSVAVLLARRVLATGAGVVQARA